MDRQIGGTESAEVQASGKYFPHPDQEWHLRPSSFRRLRRLLFPMRDEQCPPSLADGNEFCTEGGRN